LLLHSGVGIPTTGFANSQWTTNDLKNGWWTIYSKIEGTQGKVWYLQKLKAAESVINAFQSLNANILVQEFIKKPTVRFAFIVIDGRVVATIQREAMPGEFRANIHLGGTASIIKPTLKRNVSY
jgi:ribosomal protein S6--L-glutamate ligase